ncbi:SusC/RagA family TonB-linked outer membrane protein [Flavobacterium fluviatile]|uniref:SusC/RagA family TonB-linked outer membrane protein n=1 Tax=Flavobacterium fluviatile TaxID=1862387 RepID=UPI0013D7C15D|nr:TonB-dependent receptor [Flavobacterium fluviatile]
MKMRKMDKSKRKGLGFSWILLLLLLFTLGTYAQEITVKGTVIGADDKIPIPGVNVQVKGTSKVESTDFDGNYSITAKVGDLLIFSSIGMKTKNINVQGSTLNVSLNVASQELNEVVVIGYGTTTKKELTGAVGSVKASDIENQITSDLGNALQGQIAGVNVTNSSVPGASSEILIRGITSISGSNTPLYVVDGIPQEGDPRISPNEVESIDVLKDAASAAIYGTRGASGVILITTKKGKSGAMSVRMDGSYGFERIGDGQPLLNAVDQTYMNMVQDRNLNGSKDDVINIGPLTENPDRFQYDTDLSSLLFIDDASTQNYTLNVSGGDKNLKYSFVGGFFDRKGIIYKSGFQRFNTRANVNFKKDKWTVDIGGGMTSELNNRGAANTVNQLIRYQPTQSLLDVSADNVDSYGGDDFNTNVSILNSLNITDVQKSTRAFTNLSLGYQIFKGLDFSTRVGLNEYNSTRKIFRPTQSVYDATRQEYYEQPSSISQDAARRVAITWDASLTYQKTILDAHKFTFTAAVSRESYENEEFQVSKADISDNNIDVINSATGVASAQSGFDYKTRLAGYIARLQYDYKGRYLLSSSIRRDGSSRFAEQNRWGMFPSFSLGWNVSEEKFWEPIKGVVSNFKLRFSSGTVGNQNFRDYFYSTSIYRGIDYSFGPSSLSGGAIQTSIGNTDVKWETSQQNNIGFDLAFLKSKLTITGEYYRTNKEDMLFNLTLPPSVGLDDTSSGFLPNSTRPLYNSNQVVLNIGNMVNSGYELAIGYRDNIGKLKYRMNGTFSTNENKVTKIIDGLDKPILTNDSGIIPGPANALTQITAIAKGYEAGAFFVFTTDGIVDTPEKLAAYKKLDPNAQMGDLIYKDNDGDGTVRSSGDRVYAGSGLPKYEIGYSLNLDYRNFDFSMNIYSAIGHEIVNGARATALGYGRGQELLDSYSDVNPTGSLPAYRGIYSAHPNYTPNTDLYIEDGSYMRIRNLTLGYSLSKKVTSAMGIDRFRLYFTGQNLFTFTKYTGYDPEVGGNVNSRGLDKGNYPLSKMYSLGLNFNF